MASWELFVFIIDVSLAPSHTAFETGATNILVRRLPINLTSLCSSVVVKSARRISLAWSYPQFFVTRKLPAPVIFGDWFFRVQFVLLCLNLILMLNPDLKSNHYPNSNPNPKFVFKSKCLKAIFPLHHINHVQII